MWIRNFLLILLLQGIVLPAVAQAPTTGASNFSITNNDGNRLRVNWTRGNGANVLVVASTSATFNGTGIPADGTDYVESATFGLGNEVGAGNYVVYEGTGTNITVTGLVHSTTYYFRIYEFNGINTATQYNTFNVLAGTGSTLSPPTIGSTNLVATVTGNSASLTWTRGNGTRSLVILQAASATTNPTQYVNYSPNTSFPSGSAVGSGSVVYFNSSNSVNVTNLQPNTEYFYRVVEGNGPVGPVFDLTNTLVGSFTTTGPPTVGSTNFSVAVQQGNSITISLTRGNGTQRLIVARQDNPVIWTPTDGTDYNVSAAFGNGDDLGNNTFAVYQNTGNTFTMTGLTPATTYHFAVFEFNGAASNTFYLTTPTQVLVGQGATLSPPSTSAGSFVFTSISGYQANIAFTAGNGARRIVLAKEGSAVTDVPVSLVAYGENASYPSAPSLGTSKIVYDGAGTSFTLRDLQPNKDYHLAIFEYNGTGGPVYKQADPGTGSFTTLGKPTVTPTNLTFSNIQGDRMTLNFTSGNGYGRIVIGKQGSPVDVFPTDNLSYTANPSFGTVGTDLGGGNFVLQNNPALTGSSSASITNLAIGTTYYFAIVEYNGTGTQRIYMTGAEALTGNSSTLSAPTVQASNLTFTNITATSVTINWTNGDGTGRTVLIRQGAAIASFPVNLANYTGSANYPSSGTLGTSRIVYDGTGSSVNVFNIPPGEYHVAIIEYNGSTRPVYRNVDPLIGIVNVGAKPTVPASNLALSNIQGNRITLSCTIGDGLSRMVIAKAGSAVDAWPIDFTGYTANGNFGSGSDLGGGNFVVAFSTSSSFTISNLVPSSTYHFAILEVNGTGASAFYQESATAATISGATLSAPTLTTSSFLANNIDGNSMQVTWTRGNGAGRFIIAKAGSPVDVVPANLTDPSSSSAFGTSTHLGGGNYAVYDGSGDNFTITNLEPGTTYHFAFFEYNGTSTGKVYLTTSIGRASFTTLPRPTVAPKNLSISNVNGDRFTIAFTQGNGTRRLIVLRKGGLVNALPVDLTTYTAGAFGVGSQIGTGNYVTTITNGNAAIIQGLEPDTPYGVAVFELDGSNGNQHYLTTAYINQLVRTAAAPTISTSTMLYNAVGSTSINLSWTNGNGAGRMVVLRPFQPVTFVPTVLSTHGSTATNYTSTSGNLPSSHKHVDRDNITTVTITNLTPGTTYHVAIFEYNGSTQPVYREIPLRGFFTTLPASGLAIGGFDAITFCPAQQVDVPYFFTGVLTPGNIMSVELSDITGSFASPMVLGTQSTTNASGFITSTLPVSLSEGIGYRLRVRASNPGQVSADNGANLQVATSVQPSFTVVGGQVSSCGTPIQLTTSQPGYNVQWFKDALPISAAITSSYMVRETGNYQVQISGASGGCQLLSTSTTITISQRPTFDFQFPSQYCEGEEVNVAAQTLPSGGTFAGSGISAGMFNSVAAGVGQHILEYTYVDAVSSCTYTENTQVAVAGLPAAPITTGSTICEGLSAVLTASGALDGEYVWYDVASGGTAITGAVNSTFTTPIVTSSSTYFVAINDGLCESVRTSVTATTQALPVAPSTTGATICDSGSLVLTASGGTNGQYKWYTTASGGSPLSGETSETFTTPVINATTTYFVSIDNGTCESGRTPVEALIVNTSAAPTVTPASACGSSSLTLTASGGSAGQYRWYENASGGTAFSGETNASFTTPMLVSSTTYYVSIINGICESARVPVLATIHALPAKPVVTVTGALSFCQGESIVLTASPANGYAWSTGETAQTIQVSTAGTFTLQVSDANGCVSAMSDPIVTSIQSCAVNQPPSIDTAPLTTQVGGQVSFNVLNLLDDPDGNLDLNTLQILTQPVSGATASIDASGNLVIDYDGITFTGTDRLVIQVCDLAGSCTQQELTVEVVGEVEIYNAISPNGDGLNDVFIIQHIDEIPETAENNVMIYNRWGDEVFSVSNYNNDTRVFKGLSNSGKELTSGTYFYKIQFASGRPEKSGYLLLKR